jgi:hypothetical protein
VSERQALALVLAQVQSINGGTLLMSFAHMLADVEKLVLLHDDGLIPRLVASLISSPYCQSGAPLGSFVSPARRAH